MDYDATEMPAAYDAGRSYAPEVLDFWLDIVSRSVGDVSVSDILDLGCGTGRYSAALAARFGGYVVGVDPSSKMLAEARRKCADRVSYVFGAAEQLPLMDASVDMVFMSMVLHHFVDPKRALHECRRVLRPNGVVCLRTGTTDRTAAFPFVPFFPRSRALFDTNLRSVTGLEALFAEAGFQCSHHEIVTSESAVNWAAYAEKTATGANSILAQLTDAEFAEGVAALRAYAAARPPNTPVIEPIDFFVYRTG